MHNNFYFLRQVTARLASRLKDAVVSACFSQSKDELILRFEAGPASTFLRANLSPEPSSLLFTETFHRARRNSVDLFPEVVGRRVREIRQLQNERSFAIVLSGERALLFKMHPNRANVILFEDGRVANLFRNNIEADRSLSIDALDRDIDWTEDAFLANRAQVKSLYFTFGKVVWHYLEEQGFSNTNSAGQWEMIQRVRAMLENPSYYISMINGKPVLSLVKTGEIKKVCKDPLEASNEFFYFFSQVYAFAKEKNRLQSVLNTRISAGENYVRKNAQKLREVQSDNHYKVWADLIMANLHAIVPGTAEVVLDNFYDDMRPVKVLLKKDLTAQKNAEIFYRKAKNQHIEIERLRSSVEQKQSDIGRLRDLSTQVEHAGDLKELRALAPQIGTETDSEPKISLPYYEFRYNEFRILVGKNAAANDLLTMKFSHKDDLWLHAKDVTGSHVVIKHRSGKDFPRDVIEYAASLAAFNSKRKGESLCPVIVTPRKFVRKRKGDPPGAVVVEREEVVMVEPLRP